MVRFTPGSEVERPSPFVEASGLEIVFQGESRRFLTLRDLFVRQLSGRAANSAPWEDVVVARGLDFQLRPGDRAALLGVNGAGKTSLCRCIAGQYAPTQGTLRVRGRVRAILETRVGLSPELSGRENARLLARFYYPEATDAIELADEAVQFASLGRFADMPFRTYSRGMQARLALSLASARPAEILVLDEVFDGTDAHFRDQINGRLLRAIESSGIVFFVSHAESQIRQVCNRLMLLHEGRLVWDGDVDGGFAEYHRLNRAR